MLTLLLLANALAAPTCEASKLEPLEGGLIVAPELLSSHTLARDLLRACPGMPGDLSRWLEGVRAGEPSPVDRSWSLVCARPLDPAAPALWERRRLALGCDLRGLPGGAWGFTMASGDAVGAASLRAWMISEGMSRPSADAAYQILAGPPQVQEGVELPVVRGPWVPRTPPTESFEVVLGMDALRLPSGVRVPLDRGRLEASPALREVEVELEAATAVSQAQARGRDQGWAPLTLVVQADARVEASSLGPLVDAVRPHGVHRIELVVEVLSEGGEPRPERLGVVPLSLDEAPASSVRARISPWGYWVEVGGASIPPAPGCAADGPPLCEALAPWVLARTLRRLRPSGALVLEVDELPVGSLATHAAVLSHRLDGPLGSDEDLQQAGTAEGPWFEGLYLGP